VDDAVVLHLPFYEQGSSFTSDDLAAIEDGARALCTAKYDEFVPEVLLRRLWGRQNADIIRAIPETARRLLAR
jgi:ATP-dependent Lhr-like helicase